MNEEFRKGATVEITNLYDLPEKIRGIDLGMRTLHAKGFMDCTVPGFDSDAYRVIHCDEEGRRDGSWGIYFSGEYNFIPDLIG